MNPNIDTSPGAQLPEPVPQNPLTGGGQAPNDGVPSFGTGVPVPPAPGPQQQAPTAPVAAPAAPAKADDSDVIEKAWVVKAKEIVSATHNDPYEQNRQLAAFKADYLQKRYNKIIKLGE